MIALPSNVHRPSTNWKYPLPFGELKKKKKQQGTFFSKCDVGFTSYRAQLGPKNSPFPPTSLPPSSIC
jgi:hypothetical protein